MPRRVLVFALVVLAAAPLVLAQTRRKQQSGPDYTSLSVHVTDEDNRPVRGVLVQLLSGTGNVIFQTFLNEQGFADLTGVTEGRYKVRASGDDIEDTTGQEFVIFAGQSYYDAMLTVHRKPRTAQPSLNSMVHVTDLNVPLKARENFDKGTEALSSNQLQQARDYFEKAIHEYPEYAAAYNNLGIAWLREGKTEEGSTALRKAISLNPHLISAFRNLAGLTFKEGKLPETEDLLSRSLVDDPSDAEGLALLSKVQLARGKMDEAIANAKKVHAQPHEKYAFVHFIAASAFNAQGQDHQAIREYKTFLKEAPNHSSAPEARAAIQTLQARNP